MTSRWPAASMDLGDGDVTMAYETVRASTGMDLARQIAGFHAQRAVDAICRVAPDSERILGNGLCEAKHSCDSRSKVSI